MPLTRADVRHVAMLARLALEPGDEEFYAEQLSGILAHIDRLQQLDTKSIPPTAQVVEVTNTLREDIPRPCLSQEEALANALLQWTDSSGCPPSRTRLDRPHRADDQGSGAVVAAALLLRVGAGDGTCRANRKARQAGESVPSFYTRAVGEAGGRGRSQDPARRHRAAGRIPMAVKDVLCVRGVETTAGSQILRGFKPPYTGTAVSRLFDAGAVMLGVTNCDEFAMGSSTENSGYHPTHNPWDLDRVPGGSSGGSAAAVSSGEAMIALGTDTGGSIRQPAALCGVVV